MKFSLAVFSAVVASTVAYDTCKCPCGNGVGVWVDSHADGDVDCDGKPKQLCAAPSIARILVEQHATAACITHCPKDECEEDEPDVKHPSMSSDDSKSKSTSVDSKS